MKIPETRTKSEINNTSLRMSEKLTLYYIFYRRERSNLSIKEVKKLDF